MKNKKIRKRLGISTLEYGLIASLIAITAIGSILVFSNKLTQPYCSVVVHIEYASTLDPNATYYNISDYCQNNWWMSVFNLTPESSFTQVTDAAGGYAHFAQIKYNGDRTKFLQSWGIDPKLEVLSTDNENTQIQKTADDQVYANNYCEDKYADIGDKYVSSCYTTVYTALTYSGGWEPSFNNTNPYYTKH